MMLLLTRRHTPPDGYNRLVCYATSLGTVTLTLSFFRPPVHYKYACIITLGHTEYTLYFSTFLLVSFLFLYTQWKSCLSRDRGIERGDAERWREKKRRRMGNGREKRERGWEFPLSRTGEHMREREKESLREGRRRRGNEFGNTFLLFPLRACTCARTGRERVMRRKNFLLLLPFYVQACVKRRGREGAGQKAEKAHDRKISIAHARGSGEGRERAYA